MIKSFLFLAFFIAAFAFAKAWTVKTSCGTTATLHTQDNIGVDQLKEYVRLVNFDECNAYPSKVIVEL